MQDVATAVNRILDLQDAWHVAGNLPGEVLRKMDELIRTALGGNIEFSSETGCGKSTLLLSQYATMHYCFTLDEEHNSSLTSTRTSDLLRKDHVTFIEGPSQRTLLRYTWSHQLDLALIDGAHGYPFPDLDYYSFYPQLRAGALLIVDDIHIPTINKLYQFLALDKMFKELCVVNNTAFFERTSVGTFDPFGDGWVYQEYNKKHHPSKGDLVGIHGEGWWKEYE